MIPLSIRRGGLRRSIRPREGKTVRTIIALAFVVLCASAAAAEVVNVEFKFTPFTGDPENDDAVKTVAGTARVFLNQVPYAEQEVSEGEAPVMFEEREIAPSVWLPVASCGPALRHGKNTVRVEFEPADPEAPYHAQFSWASVLDETTEESEPGHYAATNQADEGMEDREAKGTVVFEREFQADFAEDLPWHHYPVVTALTDADRQALAELVARRVAAFAPDFQQVYALLEGSGDIQVEEVKKAKCLDQAWAAGLRIAAAPPADIEFVTTGNPEVVVRAKEGILFSPTDPAVFEKIEDEDMQMCALVTLGTVFPPKLVVVRGPKGEWVVVY
ncbi:MAG: hypothetical protein QUU85_09035 [Candidatus Eisenbacteria bacterium]|nr:hypothetical protein [Candidatus Eisenbacteria bacterium]